MVNRRELLLATLAPLLLKSQVRSPEANVRILEAVWQNASDWFYDARMREVDWAAVKEEFLPRVRASISDEQLLSLLREMLSRLQNSHIFLYSREEWNWRRNILPFCFERLGSRVFLRFVLRDRDSMPLAPLQFGDEIIAVDGVAADKLRPVTLARLDPIKGNPNFGPLGSSAEVEIRRRARRSVVNAARVPRPAGFAAATLEHPQSNVIHLRLFALGSRELPAARLRQIWDEVTPAKGLVLDLRNCVGGNSKVSNFIAGSLLGPGKPLFRTVPRPGSQEKELLDQSDPQAPRFVGRVAVIPTRIQRASPKSWPPYVKNTVVRGLLENVRRERSTASPSGSTCQMTSPPWRSLSRGQFRRRESNMQGRGIEPDECASNTVSDFEAKRDRALAAALRYLEQQ